MQASKKKKIIIASIILIIILAIIAVIIIKESTKPNRYLSGEMTLVDRLGKGTDHETEVYITASQDILVKVANSAKAGVYVKEFELPIYNVEYDRPISSNFTNIKLYIEKNVGQEQTEVKYPAKCSVVIVSDVLGIEIRIDFTVDQEIVYKKGEFKTNKIDPSKLYGYNEFVEEFGPIRLPDKAVIYGISSKSAHYAEGQDNVELSVVSYMYKGRLREIAVAKATEIDKFANLKPGEETKTLTVNGIEVLVYPLKDYYEAFYTDGDVIYLNYDFLPGEDESDSAMIKALEAYISK